ncbi:unnamed protein product [Caenorhabditis brenneri]
MKVLIALIALVGCSVFAQNAQILPAGNQGNQGQGTQGNMGSQGNFGNQGNMGNQGMIGNRCFGANEEMKYCGTACEPTCNNPNPVCTKQCINNVCQCRIGYVRDQNRQCVLQSQCRNNPGNSTQSPQRCNANEIFRTCGTSCEPTCNNPNPQMCTQQCIRNVCQCNTGFVRDPTTRQCVRHSQCRNINNPAPSQSPQRCNANEVFRSCGTACEPTCNNQNPQMCTLQCISNVCQCNTGFVRDSNTRQCVRPSQCRNINNPAPSQAPQRCRANESFRSCGSACEPSCQNPNPQACTMQCIPNVCQCNQGFVRGPSGCIRREACRN